MPKRTWRAVPVLAVAAVSLALAGCGGGDGDEALELNLAEQADSGQSGRATLTPAGDETTRVVVELSSPPGVPQPSHIHSGTCAEIGEVVAPLNSLVDGRAETAVRLPLDELRRGGLIVHAHKSEEESDVSVACAEIPAR
jgi:hypothetical protein